MFNQIIITGLSGVLIMICIRGFGLFIRINRYRKHKNINWIISIKENLKNILDWFAFIFFILFVLMCFIAIFLG